MPAKDLEVDLGTKPGATEFYMKYTDKNGIAEFDGIPSGSYVVYFNGTTFIKDYGSPTTTERVEINKNMGLVRQLTRFISLAERILAKFAARV